MSNRGNSVSVPFGIKNIKGLIDVINNQLVNPIFCIDNFEILTTLNPDDDSSFGLINGTTDNYQKIYRKSVLWNMGDGTEIEGYSVKHAYKIPGIYTVSCIFFDITRNVTINEYKLKIIVKEVIPSVIKFDDVKTVKNTFYCSETNKISGLEILQSLSNTIDLNIKASQVNDDEKGVKYQDIKNSFIPHLEKSFTFLENKLNKFNPTNIFKPEYENLYVDVVLENNIIDFKFYVIRPFLNNDLIKELDILDPNSNIINDEVYKKNKINIISSLTELTKNSIFCGKRAFVDIFYKNDFISNNRIYFQFDIDNSKDNYINIIPIGLNLNVLSNIDNIDKIKPVLSLNGFSNNDSSIDLLVKNSLYQNYELPLYLIPIIDNEIVNYIPKDLILNDFNIKINSGNTNELNILNIHDHLQFLKYFIIKLKNSIDISIDVTWETKLFTIRINNELINLDGITIPHEKYYNSSIDNTLNVFMQHKMFDDTPKLRGLLKNVFTNDNFLNNIISKGTNFIDDNVNIKTSYIHQLLSTLKSFDEDCNEFSNTSFESVNEMRDLIRILSINHSELIGNNILDNFDISIKNNYKGKNISDELLVDDEIYFNNNKEIEKIKRNGEFIDVLKTDSIVWYDKYTNESNIVNFSSDIDDFNGETYVSEEINYLNVISLHNYDESWGWNLILPEDYKKSDKKSYILSTYYKFFLLNKNRELKRIGNFLDDSTISPEFEKINNWYQDYGLITNMVSKVIIDSMKLQ